MTPEEAYELGREVAKDPTNLMLEHAFIDWIHSVPMNTCLVDQPVWKAFMRGRWGNEHE